MNTASYPPPYGHARTSVHELTRVRSPGSLESVEVSMDESDYRDTAALKSQEGTRGSRARGIVVRVLAYLALAAMLFVFGRVLMENPSMRRAVLEFVTFGHPEWGHRAAQWLAQHGVSR